MLLLILFIITIVSIIIGVSIIILKKKKPVPAPSPAPKQKCSNTDRNGVYDKDCNFTGCVEGFTKVNNTCIQNGSCNPPLNNPNSIYGGDSCVFQGCKDGFVPDSTNICIQKTCEQIGATDTTLPYPIVEFDRDNNPNYTTSKTPVTYGKYITSQGDNGSLYCKLDSCSNYAVKTQSTCTLNCTEGSVQDCGYNPICEVTAYKKTCSQGNWGNCTCGY